MLQFNVNKGEIMRQLVLLLAVTLAVSLAACSSESNGKQAVSPPIPVRIGKPQPKEERQTVAVSGTVASPDAPSNVSFLVSGRVIGVGPREGDYIKKGQFLAAIDPTEYRLALAAAKAQSDQARVGYERTEDEHRRMKMLYDSKSLAPNDYQKFKAARDSAAQQYQQASASEKLARKRLADATLRAPLNGYVSRRSVEPGQLAAPGQPVFEIVQLDTVEVSVGVPETDIHLVRVGQKAAVTLPALPGESFEGTVRVINVSADPNTRTFMTRITLPNPKHTLRIGMVAEARLRTDRTMKLLALPIEAIVRDPQGATMVYVYFPEQKRVYARRVETGGLYGREIEIKKGLTGKDSVVLAGQQRLRDGAMVSVTATSPPGGKNAPTEKGSRP
jgi:membrane fusion protein (multidrug efflux system)